MDRISLKAPAKINLYLKVLGKRPDGYHEIESLMQAIDLYDDITLEKSDIIELICDDPALPTDDSNLAVRAAEALQQRFYFPGVKIELRKNIPHGAGLGGGSSDAAFVLRGLCRLYGLAPTPSELALIAARIGSDVPFFLGTGQALVEGRGEIERSVKLPTAYRVLLMVPQLIVSTGEIYGNLRFGLTREKEALLFKKRITISRFQSLLGSFANDLEEAAFREFPELIGLKKDLAAAGADFCQMSGSGSAIFGIFMSGGMEKKTLAERLAPGIRAFECKPVTLQPCFAG